MSEQITKDLGGITAYAAAVAAGYTGTKSQFETLMASYATVAQNAAASASAAADSEENAEAWAVGERGGTPVSSEDDTYNNNAKYYAEEAETYAESIDPDTLAKIDGYYDTLGAGTAEQLTSNIYEEDNTPYNFRTSGGSIDIGDRETDMLVGGTVAWNQQAKQFIVNGSTFTVDGTVVTVAHNGESRTFFGVGVSDGVTYLYKPLANHKYFWSVNVTNITVSNLRFITFANGFSEQGAVIGFNTTGVHQGISKGVGDTTLYFNANVSTPSTSTGDTFTFKDMMLIDLTAMFGSTIADYIYNLEQATAGAGVAWFKKLFPKPYYAYNAGELMSVNTSAHNTVGFNAWDEVLTNLKYWAFDSSGTPSMVGHENRCCNTNATRVIPNTAYYIYHPTAEIWVNYLDADMKKISDTGWLSGRTSIITTPVNASYILFTFDHNIATYNNDICINLHWDGERDGEYEAYDKHSYPLDSSLTLRGIPKLDASNNLYYDGDTYASDGTVTRKYGIVDLGTLTWSYTSYGDGSFYASVPTINKASGWSNVPNIVCSKYKTGTGNEVSNAGSDDKVVSVPPNQTNVIIKDLSYGSDAAAFKTAMSGVYLVYELATPTTETADTYTNPQIVNDFGTEEYVDYAVSQGDRDVSIPVGHETQYMANLKAKLEMSPNSPEGAGDYIVRQTNGENEYVTLASNATIQNIIARLEALEGGGE